jgi:hypothetical protein
MTQRSGLDERRSAAIWISKNRAKPGKQYLGSLRWSGLCDVVRAATVRFRHAVHPVERDYPPAPGLAAFFCSMCGLWLALTVEVGRDHFCTLAQTPPGAM